MQRRVEHELADADAALLVVDGAQGVGPGDRFIAKALLGGRRRDPGDLRGQQVSTGSAAPRPRARWRRRPSSTAVDEVFPVSAKTRDGARAADRSARAELLPEGPLLYPPEDRTDLPSEVHLAELIREQVLQRTRDEVPHAVEVVVDEVSRRDDGLVEVGRRSGSRPSRRRGS